MMLCEQLGLKISAGSSLLVNYNIAEYEKLRRESVLLNDGVDGVVRLMVLCEGTWLKNLTFVNKTKNKFEI